MNISIIKFRIKGRGCWFGASIVNNAEVLFSIKFSIKGTSAGLCERNK